MRVGYPQPDVPQLRLGLHLFVVALALAVLLRAVLLEEDAAGATSLLVVLFIVLYVVLARAASTAARRLLVLALVGVWVGLVLVGADAAYVSVGLFLVFLTEFDLLPALAGVVAVTVFDAALGLAQEGSIETLLGPLLGAVLSVLLGIGYRVLFEATTSQRMLIDELRRTRAELADSERAAGRATERQRLAREIHDTVAQGLSSIQLLLHAAESEPLPAAVRGRLELARETAGSSLKEARRMVAELAPADLADASLHSALQRVCERAVIEVSFLADGEPVSLPMPVEAALVRITQSALANVEQHAGPQARAVVSLSRSGGRVRLDVVDDGRGSTPRSSTRRTRRPSAWTRSGAGSPTSGASSPSSPRQGTPPSPCRSPSRREPHDPARHRRRPRHPPGGPAGPARGPRRRGGGRGRGGLRR